jgi:hypothetical protein
MSVFVMIKPADQWLLGKFFSDEVAHLSGVSTVLDPKSEADWISRRMKNKEGRSSALSDEENPVAFAQIY